MHPRTRRRLEEALGVLRQARTLGLKPDLITYSALISACEKVGDCDKAWVRQRMHALSLRTVPLQRGAAEARARALLCNIYICLHMYI